MRLSFDDIAGAVGGTVIPGSAMPTRPVEGVSTDSRDVTPGSLFVCIPGETFDGHDFAARPPKPGPPRCSLPAIPLTARCRSPWSSWRIRSRRSGGSRASGAGVWGRRPA